MPVSEGHRYRNMALDAHVDQLLAAAAVTLIAISVEDRHAKATATVTVEEVGGLEAVAE